MDQQEVLSKIAAILVKNLGVEENEVTMEARFLDDLGSDSILLAEIIMELEDVYHLRISDEDAAHIRTVGDAVQYILTHGGKNAA